MLNLHPETERLTTNNLEPLSSMQTWRRSLKSLSIFPVPSTTEASRIIGDRNRQAGSPRDSLVEILSKRPAAGRTCRGR